MPESMEEQKRVILDALEEKREAYMKDLEAASKDPAVRKYLELRVTVDRINAAISSTKTGGIQSSEDTSRTRAYRLHHEGGRLLGKVAIGRGRLLNVFENPARLMLAEFRGRKGVTTDEIFRWGRIQFGLSKQMVLAYLKYARDHKAAIPNASRKTSTGTRVYSYDFPERDVSGIPHQDKAELRKAGLIR